MKDYSVGLEFADGSYDLRTVKANNENEAIKKAISQNNTRLNNEYFPNTIEAISGEIH